MMYQGMGFDGDYSYVGGLCEQCEIRVNVPYFLACKNTSFLAVSLCSVPQDFFRNFLELLKFDILDFAVPFFCDTNCKEFREST